MIEVGIVDFGKDHASLLAFVRVCIGDPDGTITR